MATKKDSVDDPEFEGMEQERIPEVETRAKKYATQRGLEAGIKKDKANALFKLTEALKENKEKLANNGDGTFSYVRGGFEIILSEKDSIAVTVPGEETAKK